MSIPFPFEARDAEFGLTRIGLNASGSIGTASPKGDHLFSAELVVGMPNYIPHILQNVNPSARWGMAFHS
jgi:hypothetical protein